MAFVPVADQVAIDVEAAGGAPGPNAMVTFRGYLSEPSAAGIHRLYIRPSFDAWVELPANDIVAQVPGSNQTGGESLVWVRRDATIARGATTSAIELATAEVDPTDPAAGYYPNR